MVSRTSTAGQGSTVNQNNVSTTTGVQNQSSSGSSSASSNTSGVQTTNADYLDSASRKALNDLIKGLTSRDGAAAQFSEERLNEINTNQANRGDYSKAAAFADSQAAMNANLVQALTASMPAITAGIDAAGTSGSAMSALLTQQAAENAAQQAAQLGLSAAIDYGQLQVGFGNILEQLTAQGDPVTNQLLEALGIAKGASEKSTVKTESTTNESSSQSSNSTTTGSSTTIDSGTTTQTPNATKKSSGSYVFQQFPDMGSVKRSNASATTNNNTTANTGYKGAYGF